jgi:hypothetical protein
MTKFGIDVRKAAKRSVRVYFAPLVGAFTAVRAELRREDRQSQRARVKPERDTKHA